MSESRGSVFFFCWKSQLTKLISILEQKSSDVRIYGCVSVCCHPSLTSLIFRQIVVLMAPFHHILFASLLVQIKLFSEDKLHSTKLLCHLISRYVTICATSVGLRLNYLNLWIPAVSLLTTRFNNQKFYMVLALRSVFCVDLRTDSGLCCIRH
jgi:hypothetical protein